MKKAMHAYTYYGMKVNSSLDHHHHLLLYGTKYLKIGIGENIR